jgi:hypothetical protein
MVNDESMYNEAVVACFIATHLPGGRGGGDLTVDRGEI